MRFKSLLLVLVLILVAVPVLADQTQLYSKIFLNPYYREATIANTGYNYTLAVNPPDGLTSVFSATVTFEAYFTPSVNVTLKVNNQTCNSPSFYISTTYAGSAQMTASFDCSNIIKEKGNYTIEFKATKNTGAINGWLDLTYTNKPLADLTVFGTEYQIGQSAKAWLQLLDANGTYIPDGACFVDIYTPDNVIYLEQAQMQYLEDGVYYYDLPAPAAEGVYPVIARCFYQALAVDYYATDYFINNGTLDSAWIPANLYATDGDKVNFKEANYGGVRRLDAGLNFTNMSSCLAVPESLLTGVEFYVYGRFDSVDYDDITISVYNWSSSSWLELSNKLTEGAATRSTSNTFFFNNLTTSGLYNETAGGLLMKFNDTALADGGDSKLELDEVYVACDQLAFPVWQEVMGSSEMHVTNTTNILTGIMDYLQNTIYPYLQQMWNKLLGIETQLNTTIILNTEMNQTTHLIKNDTSSIIDLINSLNVSSGSNLNALNASMMAGFAEKDAHIQDSYNNLTAQAASAYANTTSNFNSTWNLLNLMEQNQNATNSQILNWLLQIDTNINSSKTLIMQVNSSLTTNMNLINSSLSVEIGAVNTSILNSIDVLNATTAANFDDVRSLINALSIQVSQNHNITQDNITQLKDLCALLNISITQDFADLNSSLQIVRTDILTEINTSIETMLLINNTLSGKLDLINASLYTEISSMRSEIQANFTDVFFAFSALSADLNGTKAELKSDIYNLSLQLNETKWQLHGHLDALNQSIQEDYALLKNDTNTIISMIGNFSATFDGNFTQVLSAIGSLSTQVDLNHNITQSNLSDIRTDISLLNQSVTTNFNTLNSTIAAAEQNVLNKINDTITLIGQVNQSTQDTFNLLNQTMINEFIYTNSLISAMNQSVTQQITDLRSDMNSNFSATFSLLGALSSDLNATRQEIRGDISNLSLQLNETKWQLYSHLDALNSSLWSKMDGAENKTDYAISLIKNLTAIASNNSEIMNYLSNMNASIANEFSGVDWQFNTTWELINNVSQQVNFTPVFNSINALSVQVDTNHNITQQNITQIFNKLDALNDSATTNFNSLNQSISNFETKVDNYVVWLNGTLIEMKSEISNIENMTLIINQTVVRIENDTSYIIDLLGSWENLTLSVEAPAMCLYGTNWIVRAQVTDKFHVIMSPLDGVYCNVTTDLWGTASMTYSYLDQKWKYIHPCDPNLVTFDWNVECDYLG